MVTELLEKTGLKYEHLIGICRPLQVFKCCVMLSIFQHPCQNSIKRRKKDPNPEAFPTGTGDWNGFETTQKMGFYILQMTTTLMICSCLMRCDINRRVATPRVSILFQIRYTKRVSMFPVGLITKLGVSSPIVKNGVFSGFYDGWMAGRKFPVDMAGFAVSVRFLLKRPKALMPFKPGFEEDGFLKSLEPFEPQDIELLASNCTKVRMETRLFVYLWFTFPFQILVWHTQTKKNEPSQPLDFAKYNNTNLVMLKQILV